MLLADDLRDEYEKYGYQQDRFKFSKKIAQDLIGRAKIDKPPINLSNVVKYLKLNEGFTFYIKPVNLPDTYSGQIAVSGKIIGILYNENHPRVRQRFTVAHELGHLIIGNATNVSSTREVVNLKTKSPAERESNIFAAELLMPKKILRDELKGNNYSGVEELAKAFWVSEEAMWFKLEEENLIKLL